jgi:hypothetical protein
MGKCIDAQNEKADRWLSSVVESYARWASEAMANLAHGGETFDLVDQLRTNEAAFREYRRDTTDLVNRFSLVGSINKLQVASTYFRLTVDRAHLLLRTCGFQFPFEGLEGIDLTLTDWCPPAP